MSLAVTRREGLLPLMQAAVRDAERRRAARRSAERDRVAPERLAPEAVRTMADQVLHTALNEHDRTCIEPDHLNGIAWAIARVTSAGDGSEPWSSGQAEGQIDRLKLIKRQSYGRAGIDLPQRRMVLAA